MLKKASSSKMKKMIAIPVAGVIAATVLGVSLYNSVEPAYAKASLPKIEDINQNNNKTNAFTILEIVPSYQDAKIGYLVSGQEPAYYSATKGVKAFDDMASKEERDDRFPKAAGDFTSTGHDFTAFSSLKDKAFSWNDYTETTESTTNKEIFGLFSPVSSSPADGDYINNKSSATSYKVVAKETEKDDAGKTSISEVISSTNDESTGFLYSDDIIISPAGGDDTTKYNFKLKKYDGTKKRPFAVTVGTSTYFDWEYYITKETSYYAASEVVEEGTTTYKLDNSIPVGSVLYNMDAAGSNLEYIATVYHDETSNKDRVYMAVDSELNVDTDDDGTMDATDGKPDSFDLEGDTDSFAYKILHDGLHVYTLKYYNVDEDSARSEERFIVNTIATDSLYPATIRLIDKNIRLGVGEDAAAHGIDVDDDLTDHIFYYMPANEKEYVYSVSNTGTDNFVQSYAQSAVDTFKYNGGFTNNEWFKQLVLDLEANECANSYIDVVTKLPSEVATTDIDNADFIYIQGGDYTKTKDMSKEVAQYVIGAVKANKPIALEGNLLYDGVYNSTTKTVKENEVDHTALTNLYYLDILLGQLSLTDVSIDEYLATWNSATDTVDNKYAGSRCPVVGSSYTNRTVFVFNGDSKVTGNSIVCPDFGTTLSGENITFADGTTLGYDEVKEDIENEKFYIKVAGSTASFNENISIATCIRHIINYGDRRVTSKAEIRVLDLEPFYSEVVEKNPSLFGTSYETVDSNNNRTTKTGVTYDATSRDILTQEWVVKNIGTQIKNLENVKIKGMGTREFVGNITDLNANYDLIYIGLDTQYMTTKFDGNTKTHETIYNDSTMNGRIYSHIGDLIYANWNSSNGDRMATSGTYRSSGNDLTFEKVRNLQSYVEAGYAMILSDDFYLYNEDGTIKEVNTTKIDPKSYMYDFAKWLLDKKYIGSEKNVTVRKDFLATTDKTTTKKTASQNRENFSKYLSISKLIVTPIKTPIAYYNVTTDPTNNQDKEEYNYLTMNKDGVYTLDFQVKLTNDAAVDTSKTSYDCKLYIDHDADGRFEDVEALNGLTITDSNGNAAEFDSSAGVFKLTTGKTYDITRRVPEGYVGFLPWKIVFYENDRTFSDVDNKNSTNLISTAIQGYSAVPDYTQRPQIKILQITSGSSVSTNLDLKNDDTLKNLYKQVKDFEIVVEKITMDDFIKNENNKLYTGDKLDYLMNYDMLVMGFIDMYRVNDSGIETDKAIFAIREYILSGRSMLFTHDLNSTKYNISTNGDSLTTADRDSWGGLANMYLRDVQGMDRYGVTQYNLSKLESTVGKTLSKNYLSRYDNDANKDIFGNDSSKSTTGTGRNGLIDKYGWNSSTLLRYHYTDKAVNGFSELSMSRVNGLLAGQEGYESTKVTRTNQGQITEYPFHIEEEITVANTHPQYFQLNLDTDSKDSNYDDDIVVWYTISNQNNDLNAKSNIDKVNYYTYDYNDARNNYFIYNKGNITYTGSGHDKNGITGLEEKKLFVNTLVAAYNAGDHAPFVKYKESAWDMSADITSMYVPYDNNLETKMENGKVTEEGGFLGNTITVNFKTINNNLQNNAEMVDGKLTYKPIIAEYYVEDSSGAIKIGSKNYSVIPASAITIKKIVDSNNRTLETPEAVSNIHVLENYTIYKAQINLSVLSSTGAVSEDGIAKLKLNNHNTVLYTRLSMSTSVADMDKSIDVLPATDSMSPLNVNFTELYELR